MGQIFTPYEPDRALLLPLSPRDWLPEGQLVSFISETLEQLDLSPYFARYEQREGGRGNCPHAPARSNAEPNPGMLGLARPARRVHGTRSACPSTV
jgi:hypothetical protein